MSTPVKFVNKRALHNNKVKKNALVTQHLVNLSNAYKSNLRQMKTVSTEPAASSDSIASIFALGQFLNNTTTDKAPVAPEAPVAESGEQSSVFALGQFLNNNM